MIQVVQSYKLNGSTGSTTLSYTMTPSGTCVSVTPASGTVTPGETVEFTFLFQDENCFSTNFTLVTTDDVCPTSTSKTFTIANPCSTLTSTISNSPSSTNPFIFTHVISGGSGDYNVTWNYNTSLFSLLSTSNTKLELNLVNSSVRLPDSTTIRATITDSNGCTHTSTYIYTFCQPIANSQYLNTICIPEQIQGTLTVKSAIGNVELTASECAGTSIVWSTLDLDYDTTKLVVTVTDDYFLTIYGVAVTTSTVYNITWTVKNNYGVTSTTATLAVLLPACSTPQARVVIPNSTTKLLTADSSSDVKYLDVEAIVFTA